MKQFPNCYEAGLANTSEAFHQYVWVPTDMEDMIFKSDYLVWLSNSEAGDVM
jgi:hypothetical protein